MAQHNPADDEATCENAECDQPTPWDMPSVHLDDDRFCSPGCAREYLDRHGVEFEPQRVTLHDPQFAVDRSDLPGVGEDDVTLGIPVSHVGDAHEALDDIDEMFPGEFRPAADDSDGE